MNVLLLRVPEAASMRTTMPRPTDHAVDYSGHLEQKGGDLPGD